jgi:hypothetical protein
MTPIFGDDGRGGVGPPLLVGPVTVAVTVSAPERDGSGVGVISRSIAVVWPSFVTVDCDSVRVVRGAVMMWMLVCMAVADVGFSVGDDGDDSDGCGADA